MLSSDDEEAEDESGSHGDKRKAAPDTTSGWRAGRLAGSGRPADNLETATVDVAEFVNRLPPSLCAGCAHKLK